MQATLRHDICPLYVTFPTRDLRISLARCSSLSYITRLMEPNPVALRQDPIVEATFEVRFSCADPAAGDLLPGMLFPRLRGHFGTLASLQLRSYQGRCGSSNRISHISQAPLSLDKGSGSRLGTVWLRYLF